MKGKRWFLVGFLILAVSVVMTSCKEDSDKKTTTPTDTTRTFLMEYDHMVSYDVFSGVGEDRVRNAFSRAKTSLNIHWSNWISDQVWDYDSLEKYVDVYANRYFNSFPSTRNVTCLL